MLGSSIKSKTCPEFTQVPVCAISPFAKIKPRLIAFLTPLFDGI
ncbi:hypothetical protein [Lutibacter oceani]|nr:hypothetical protein [Lutibacter oceani]